MAQSLCVCLVKEDKSASILAKIVCEDGNIWQLFNTLYHSSL